MPSAVAKLRARLTTDPDAWNHPRRAKQVLATLGFVAALLAIAIHSVVLVHRGIDIDPTVFMLAVTAVSLASGYAVLALLD
ncbi:hypothetical protein [Halobaculum marinum]|uniref:Uncharacterized protein n=1 Tax=Halobaculum marinum TaxID=3031996 RepID=A0ABD5X001_9EURY|nr:hypothetical protein [Halobaculum sp. DT55]